MNPIRCGAAALITLLMVAAGCGGGGDGDVTASTTTSTSTSTSSTTTTTTKPKSDVPPLPTPLPPVRDPGTIDQVLGDFPADETRAVQFAWVTFAPDGREYTVALRSFEPFFRDYNEEDLYTDGVYACTQLRRNYEVSDTLNNIGETYSPDDAPLTEDQVFDIGSSVLVVAVQNLCPDMQPLFDDPDLQVDTAVAIRAILGLDDEGLADDEANKFANYVCQQRDRGTTISRVVSDIADEFEYPDDLAEDLINYIDEFVCS